MPKVSVIVPVYNVEKYLDRCVQSLINQTLQDIEIILVDDGSPDLCPQICDRYATEDKRITVVHKENGGLSSARNAGLKIAAGDYIGFVDSDDDVELNMYERMSSIADQNTVDFVMSDYLRIPQSGNLYIKTLNIDEGYYDKDKIRKDIFPQLIMGENLEYGPLLSVWHCLYRKRFLDEFSLTFSESVKWSEDNLFSAIMGYHCNSFYYLKGEALYHYYQNAGSITTAYRNGAWDVYSCMHRQLHEFFDGVDDYDFSRQLKLHIIFYACNSIGQEIIRPRNEAIRGIRNVLNSQYLAEAFQGFSFPRVSIKLRIQLLLIQWKQATLLYIIKKY